MARAGFPASSLAAAVTLACLGAVSAAMEEASPTPTAREGGFDSALMEPGQSWTQTFAATGTFEYFCRPHPYMRGSVVVSGDAEASGDAAVRIQNFAFQPAEIQVRPGAVVTWTNADSVGHTVTEIEGASGGEATGYLLVVIAIAAVAGVAVLAALRLIR